MTISFSYAYLKGLLRFAALPSPPLPVVMAVHRSTRAISPRRTGKTAISLGLPRSSCELTIHQDRFGHIIGIMAGHNVINFEHVSAEVQGLPSEHATIGAVAFLARLFYDFVHGPALIQIGVRQDLERQLVLLAVPLNGQEGVIAVTRYTLVYAEKM